MPAAISKRSIDDGNQLGGCSLQPVKKESLSYQISINFLNS
ncbi:MAG: hypothetical protein ACTSPQ_19760 [Candidatus Helarchaeota archaeon]